MHAADFFTDSNGNRVIAQKPNAPIIIWFGCVITARLINDEQLANYVSNVGTIALFIWAITETAKGANLFRRTLGTIVLISILISLIA